MKNLSTEEMAELLGKAWANNQGNDFIALFSDDAVIDHPFFVNDESPQMIVDILNCNVKGTSEYLGYELVSGLGEGKDDVIKMYFLDTGTNCGYVPKYQGKMIITAYIKEHQFTRFEVFGYEIVKSDNEGKKHQLIKNIDVEDSRELAELAGKAWESNNMDLFTSLFTKEAQIYHPLFKKPVTPDIVSDVLNSPMEGFSKLKDISLISGNGDGEEDIIDMYFEETGVQLGYLPELMGVLHMTAKVKNKRFSEFIVHSYTPVETTFKPALQEENNNKVKIQKMSKEENKFMNKGE